MKNIIINGVTFRVSNDFEERYAGFLNEYLGKLANFELVREENLLSGNYYGNGYLESQADEAFNRLYDEASLRGDIYFLCRAEVPNSVRL